MCKLSQRETEVMKILLEGVVPSAAAKHLGMTSEKEIGVYKSRVKRKIFIAEQFLKEMRQYRKVLDKPREYKPQPKRNVNGPRESSQQTSTASQ